MGREPFERIGDARCSCFDDVYMVAAVMVGGRADVPSRDAMWCPCFADIGFFVHDDFGAQWAKRSSVEIESAMQLGLCRERGVDARAAEKVKGHEGLGDKAVPKVQWELGVSTT